MVDYSDYDEPRRSNGGIWGMLIVLLILGGGAGFYVLNGTQQEKAQPATAAVPTGPVQVISAQPVPPDTQGPGTIADANAEQTSGTEFKSGGRRRGSGIRRSSGSSSSGSSNRSRKRTTKVVHTDDPLDGFVE